MVKQREYHYEVFSLEIDQSRQGQHFIPFTIKLPHDVNAVVGVQITTDAKASVGLVDELSFGELIPDVQLKGDIEESQLRLPIKKAQQDYLRSGRVHGKIIIDQGIQANASGVFPREYWIRLDKFRISEVSLQSYEKSGQFYSQDINPGRFIINGYHSLDRILHQHLFYLNTDQKKQRNYVPVMVEGTTKELFGFLKTTDFGKTVASPNSYTDEEKAERDYLQAPYMIRIYLKCTLKG